MDEIMGCIELLRQLGCAVCVITPEDIQNLAEVTEDQAFAWMCEHSLDVEDAIMGDYWSESVRAVLDQYPIGAE